MAIGNDDLDFYDDIDDISSVSNEPNPSLESDLNSDEGQVEDTTTEEDFITSVLKARGIEDKSKIKFENEEGSVEERDWDDLTNEEKTNILNSSVDTAELDLSEPEIQLIDQIRKSGMTPSDYLQYILEDGVNRYIQNAQGDVYQYEVDQYSDDELYIYDLMTRSKDITKEEALELLERAKYNEALFAKQVGAIRNEYKSIEEENIRKEKEQEDLQAQEQYAQFANKVAEQISNFTEFSGYELNMEDDDKNNLYSFITGVDQQGNNYLAKALSDPNYLVKAAWFILNGEQMIDDITTYFQNEIKQVSKKSYEKGLAEGKDKANTSKVVYKQKGSTVYDDDLDEI